MCGVLAFFPLAEGYRVDRSVFKDALATQRSRGPDGLTFAVIDQAGSMMGHSLLSITDPSRAHERQPVTDGRYTLAFNGELYNHRELRAELALAGVVVDGFTDTAVLFAGLRAFGTAFLSRIAGCWSYVMHDAMTNAVFFGRDFYGEKQLVFSYKEGKHLCISSTAKAIHCLDETTTAPDRSRLEADLVMEFFASRHGTYFAHIDNTKPGLTYHLDLHSGKLTSQTLREPDPYTDTSSGIKQALKQAVASMIPEHRKYGVVLSGGLDSSIIAAEVAKTCRNVPALTVSYNNSSNEDLQAAILLCKSLKSLEHNCLELSSRDLADKLEETQNALEEPVYDQVYVSQYLIYSWFRKNNLDVALNGQASDEFWRGYHYHYNYAALDRCEEESDLARFFVERAISKGLNTVFSEAHIRKIAEEDIEKRSLTDPSFGRAADQLAVERHLQSMLSHEDRLSMSSGVEVRLPFLHRSVLSWAKRYSVTSKIVDGIEKSPLRDAFADALPQEIVHRRKQAFPDAPSSTYVELFDLFSIGVADRRGKTSSIPQQLQWRIFAQDLFCKHAERKEA